MVECSPSLPPLPTTEPDEDCAMTAVAAAAAAAAVEQIPASLTGDDTGFGEESTRYLQQEQ